MTTPLVSRGIYGFAGAVLAGLISATIFSVALSHTESLIAFIVLFTAIPLFIAGLGAGSFAGGFASAAGFINLLISDPSNHAVLYAILYAIPAFALTALALRYRTGSDEKIYWYPEGNLLTAITFYPCILFLIMSAMATGHDGGLLALTHEFFDVSANAAKKGFDADTKARAAALFDVMARYMPALIGVGWTLITMVSMVVSQNALQQHQWNLRSTFVLSDLRLPNGLINAVAVTGLIGVAAPDPFGYTGINLAIMLGMPFLFAGLAVIHAWAGTKKGTKLILFGFYLMLILVSFLTLIVVLLGVIDQWANFRQRFTKQTKTT